MSDYVTKADLKEALSGYATKQDLQEALSRYATKQDLRETGQWIVDLLVTEMGTRFGEVNQRLDRMDATLTNHGRQIAAGTKAIAGFTEWFSKSDADYTRVLAELTELKVRIGKLEGK